MLKKSQYFSGMSLLTDLQILKVTDL